MSKFILKPAGNAELQLGFVFFEVLSARPAS